MRNIKALLATSALGAVLLTGCSLGDFGDINKNPNRPSEAQTDMFFTYACKYTYDFTLNNICIKCCSHYNLCWECCHGSIRIFIILSYIGRLQMNVRR